MKRSVFSFQSTVYFAILKIGTHIKSFLLKLRQTWVAKFCYSLQSSLNLLFLLYLLFFLYISDSSFNFFLPKLAKQFATKFLRKYSILADIMHQSIPAATSPSPPPCWPPSISFFCFFLPWMANTRGWGLLRCQIPRGRDEKRVQMPRLHQNCNIFHWSYSRIMPS